MSVMIDMSNAPAERPEAKMAAPRKSQTSGRNFADYLKTSPNTPQKLEASASGSFDAMVLDASEARPFSEISLLTQLHPLHETERQPIQSAATAMSNEQSQPPETSFWLPTSEAGFAQPTACASPSAEPSSITPPVRRFVSAPRLQATVSNTPEAADQVFEPAQSEASQTDFESAPPNLGPSTEPKRNDLSVRLSNGAVHILVRTDSWRTIDLALLRQKLEQLAASEGFHDARCLIVSGDARALSRRKG